MVLPLLSQSVQDFSQHEVKDLLISDLNHLFVFLILYVVCNLSFPGYFSLIQVLKLTGEVTHIDEGDRLDEVVFK